MCAAWHSLPDGVATQCRKRSMLRPYRGHSASASTTAPGWRISCIRCVSRQVPWRRARADSRARYRCCPQRDHQADRTAACQPGDRQYDEANSSRPSDYLALASLLSPSRWVDAGLLEGKPSDLTLLCSMEFFVLDSADSASIAFLAPLLPSRQLRAILAASQEGGHHPLFNERALTALSVPAALLERRSELSARVECAVDQTRRAYREIRDGTESLACSIRPKMVSGHAHPCSDAEASRGRFAGVLGSGVRLSRGPPPAVGRAPRSAKPRSSA